MSPHRWHVRAAVVGAVTALVVGMGAGAAYGYYTATGSGTGSASGATMLTVTLATAGTPSAPLLPGGSGDVVLRVTNPNPVVVSLTSVAPKVGASIMPDAGHSGCSTTDGNPVVTFKVPPADLPVSVPASSTVSVDLAGAVTMDVAATSSCQGATFTVPVTITAHEA